MRYFSMFSGIGGFEVGIEEAFGICRQSDMQRHPKSYINECIPKRGNGTINPACIGFSEIDRYAVSIYRRHFPDHKNFGDATELDPGELPDFDLLVGGFPCQAFSIAGKRAGFLDARGTLFFEIARVLEHKRPRYFLLENVEGLLSHDDRKTIVAIIGVLADLNYRISWQVLNTKDYGLPQNRERIFIAGRFGGERGPEVFPVAEANSVHPGESRQSEIANCLDSTYHKGWRDKGQRTMIEVTSGKAQGARVYLPDGISATISSQGGGQGAKTGLYAVQLGQGPNTRSAQSGTMVGGDIAFTLRAGEQNGVMLDTRIRRLTPTECERLQGFPDGWTEYGTDEDGKKIPISDTQRYKCLGNAVSTNVIARIISGWKELQEQP